MGILAQSIPKIPEMSVAKKGCVFLKTHTKSVTKLGFKCVHNPKKFARGDGQQGERGETSRVGHEASGRSSFTRSLRPVEEADSLALCLT